MAIGKVLDTAAGHPLHGVEVILQGSDPGGMPPQVDSYIAETDGEGVVQIEGAAPGHYEISARFEGYASPRRNSRVIVDPAGPAPEFTIRLIPLGAICGHIGDSDGNPIAGAVVEALSFSWATGKKQLRTVAAARSDDRGEYRLFGLAPGRYRLRASQPFPAVGSSSRSMPVWGGKVNQAYSSSYYPAAINETGAAALELRPGGELRDMDLQLRPEALYRIRVQVTGGNPAGTFRPAIGISNISGVGPSGSFMIGGPNSGRPIALPPGPPGTYLVTAEDRQQKLRAQRVVTVMDSDVDVTLTVAPGVTLSGSVRVEGERQIPLTTVRLHAEGEDAWNGGDGPVQTDGQFSIPNLLPGVYGLHASLPAGVYLKSIQRGDHLLENPQIDLAQNVEALLITLATDGGTLEGTVVDRQGQPVEGAAVVLAPTGELQGWLSLQRTATAGKAGQFELHDIAPGAYKLFAWEDAEPGAPADRDFRRPYESQGTVIQVTATGKQKVQVKAITFQNDQ